MTARPESMVETYSDFDLHQLLVPSSGRPRARDNGSSSSGPSSDAESFIIPEPLSRTDSMYSFSRATLSSQLASLNSLSVPQAESLAANITVLSSSRKACKALNASAEQINSWNQRALKILKELDADDDVEWAAAAGRDALEETDKTINKFENLINVYVLSIEELQTREDIHELRTEDLTQVVEQMEVTLLAWDDVRTNLKRIHDQVELAMEWEELWNTVLGEVGGELDKLSQLVFEMEEKRHMAYMTPTQGEPEQKIDINELESFIGEPEKKRESVNARFSMTFESSPLNAPVIERPQDDANLLALFARMQPLRASLDFLPMRLSMFLTRAENIFPQACSELEDKKGRLEKNWLQLTEEAERLRRELSEDRWVMVFRNAGRQAQKMVESVERSIAKVQDAIDSGYQKLNPAALARRVESFEAKKMHYMPAIQRVLSIIQKGLKDRLTVNGEILRLNKNLSAKMRVLNDGIEALESALDPVTSRSNSKLRESISSIVSADRSLSSGTFADTPGSSPASSIDLPPQGNQKPSPRYGLNGYSKPRATSRPPPVANKRRISLQPQTMRATTPNSGRGTSIPRRAISPAPGSVYQQGVYVPPTNPLPARPSSTPLGKPRWSSIVKPNEVDTNAAHRQSTRITPSSYYRMTPRSVSMMAPSKSPLGQADSSSPMLNLRSSLSHRQSNSQLRSFAERIASPGPDESLLSPLSYQRTRNGPASVGTIRSPSSLAVHNYSRPTMTNGILKSPRSVSSLRFDSDNFDTRNPLHRLGENTVTDLEEHHDIASDHDDDRSTDLGSSPLTRRTATRPPSSLATRGKRTSMLPLPVGVMGGRTSSLGFRN